MIETRLAIAAATALLLGTMATSAWSADLGGNCCADLEERIAELEATTARKGNRKVSLTISGQVSKAVLFWDDGFESNQYVVGNKNDQTNFSFDGEATIAPGWMAGYSLTLRVEDNLSDGVDQGDASADRNFQIWKSHWWIAYEKLGRIAVGRESRVSDTAPETDFSEAGLAGYAGVQDVGGGFLLRRADGAFSGLAWGDLGNHFNGDTTDLIRYDTPELMGFVVSASWGADDIWDAGIRYSGEGGGFKFEAVVAYTEVTDAPSDFADVDQSTVVGSAALLHEPSGLNALIAAGHREFDATVADGDGVLRTPDDVKFVYSKLGWLAQLNGLGPTAFYGEYGWFDNFVTSGLDADGVSSLSFTAVANVCAGAGNACRVTDSELEVWGFGVVQHIEAAEMQVFIGYRHHTADFTLVDNAGAGVAGAGIEDFDTIIAGSKIAF